MLTRLLAVALGGAVGAVSRYLVSGWVSAWSRESAFPYGTLAVNFAGSFLLGLLMGLAGEGRWLMPPVLRLALGVGCLGAFTTFSTFSYETIEALRVGDVRVAFANVALSVILALGACWIGLQVGERL